MYLKNQKFMLISPCDFTPKRSIKRITLHEKRKFLQKLLSYRCKIIKKLLNTAVWKKATAVGIAGSAKFNVPVVSRIIQIQKIYP